MEQHNENPFYIKVYEPVIWDNIRRFLPPPGGRILDVGGGTGRWTIPLARLGYPVTLVEISAGMLEIACRKEVGPGRTNPLYRRNGVAKRRLGSFLSHPCLHRRRTAGIV